MSNEMNKEMSQGTDVQTEERYQVTKRDLRKTAARYNFMAYQRPSRGTGSY